MKTRSYPPVPLLLANADAPCNAGWWREVVILASSTKLSVDRTGVRPGAAVYSGLGRSLAIFEHPPLQDTGHRASKEAGLG